MRLFMQAGLFVAGSSMVYLIVAACSGGRGGSAGDGGVIPNADAQNTNITKTLSADSDPAQAVGGGGVVSGGAPVELGTGPFYLTDFVADDDAELGTVPLGQSCDSVEPFKRFSIGQFSAGSADSMHGARFLIASNEKLCANRSSGLAGAARYRWAGFRAY